jgi:hypothetical protein
MTPLTQVRARTTIAPLDLGEIMNGDPWRARLGLLPLIAGLIVVQGCRGPDSGVAQAPPVAADEALAEVLKVRRQWDGTGLEIARLATEQLTRAEASFDRAIAAAEAGDYPQAKRHGERAAAAYRSATVRTLEAGPVAEIGRRLGAARDSMSPKRYDSAIARLIALRRSIDAASLEAFDVRGLTDAVLSSVVAIADFIAPEVAIDPERPCSAPVQPSVREQTFTAPASGAVLTRDSIHYVEGNALEVALLIPRCTFISQVFLTSPLLGGELELGLDPNLYDPIEGTSNIPYFYEMIGDELDGDDHRVTIRIRTPDFDDGRGFDVRIVIRSAAGGLSTVASFTMSLVRLVGGQFRLSYSEAELQNGFVTNQYLRFGDDGRDPGSSVTLYEPSFTDVLRLTNEGVLFKWSAKADFPICDATVRAEGRFHLDPDGMFVNVEWDVGPDVSLALPPLCELATVILQPAKDLVEGFVKQIVEDTVRDRVQAEIDSVVVRANALGLASIQSIETAPDELRVTLELPFQKVVIDVPYGRLRVDEAFGFGLPLNDADVVLPLGGSLVNACVLSQPPSDCDRRIASTGLFNWNTDVPVPSPWFVSEFGTVGYLKPRHDARKALRGLRRDPALLPFSFENPGALIARLSDGGAGSRFRFLGEPCMVSARAGRPNRLAFGANDYRRLGVQELGSGTARITVAWLRPGIGPGECPSNS